MSYFVGAFVICCISYPAPKYFCCAVFVTELDLRFSNAGCLLISLFLKNIVSVFKAIMYFVVQVWNVHDVQFFFQAAT